MKSVHTSAALGLLASDLSHLSHSQQVQRLAEINRELLGKIDLGPTKLRAAADIIDEQNALNVFTRGKA